jgi:hypothetical protein
MPRQERFSDFVSLIRAWLISIFTQCAPRAGGTEEGQADRGEMFAADQETAKLSQAGITALGNPARLAAAQLPALFIAPRLVVIQAGHDPRNPALAKWRPMASPPMKTATLLLWPTTL